MQWMRASFATVVALGLGLSAEARKANPTIVSQPALVAETAGFESFGGQNEIAENLPEDCRQVDVDIDEGYGVTGHATRDECPPRRR